MPQGFCLSSSPFNVKNAYDLGHNIWSFEKFFNIGPIIFSKNPSPPFSVL